MNTKKNNINNKINKNIFQRLFKDAEYQRIFPKRPCHFRNKKLNKSKDIICNIENNNEAKIGKTHKKINLKIGHKISNNYGEYLYEKNKKYQEEKEKKLLLIKQQK